MAFLLKVNLLGSTPDTDADTLVQVLWIPSHDKILVDANWNAMAMLSVRFSVGSTLVSNALNF